MPHVGDLVLNAAHRPGGASPYTPRATSGRLDREARTHARRSGRLRHGERRTARQQAASPSKIIVNQILPSGDCATPVPNFV
jgi:hypothetical protein